MKKNLTTFFVSLFMLTLPILSFSQAGTLDPAFGVEGIAMLSPGSIHETAHDMVILEDSSMIICGVGQNGSTMSGFLMRILPDGSQDMNFGTGGITWISYGAETYAYCMERQPDGKYVVSGLVYTVLPDSEFFIARFLVNGTPDPTFNSTGSFITAYSTSEEYLASMIMQPDGKFILAGQSYTGNFSQLLFTRVNNNGTLDNSFGTNGYTAIDASVQDESINGLGLLTDGTIIGVGAGYQTAPLWGEQVFMAKLTSSGTPFPNFGTNGVLIPPVFNDVSQAMDIEIDNDSLYLTGYMYDASNNWQLFAAKLNPSGNVYSDFGTNGISFLSLNPMNIGYDILKTSDNKLYICGTSGMGGPGNRDFLLARFLPDGELDPDMNSTGYVLTPIRPDWDEANVVKITPTGKIVLAGMTSGLSTSGNNDIAMTRYLNDYQPSGLYANYSATPQPACEGSTVQFTDFSFSTDSVVLTWQWTFEGGTPSVSTSQNPTVTYANDGIYDVQLIIYDGIYHDTLISLNEIIIEAVPAQPAEPDGPSVLCGTYSGEYSIPGVLYADNYSWQVAPGNAGTVTGNGTTAVFTASLQWTGTCSIQARAEGLCGNSPWSQGVQVEIHHNPVLFQLSGDGGFCEGDPGAEIILDGSETGINYELYRDGEPTGNIVPGTGSAISFGYNSTTGLYSASGYTDNCFEFMVGQVFVHQLLLPGQANVPNGPVDACDQDISTYTTNTIEDADVYIWTLTPEEAGLLTPVADTAHVDWNDGFSGTATLSVHAENLCGEGAESEPLNIEVNITPTPAIIGNDIVCSDYEEKYETQYNDGSFYTWEATGGIIIDGAGTHQATIRWGEAGPGTVTVSEESAQGCIGTTESFAVTIEECTYISDVDKDRILIYPNPAMNDLFISISPDVTGSVSELMIVDFSGKMVAEMKPAGSHNPLIVNVTGYPAGIYTLVARFTSGEMINTRFVLIK